MRKRHFKYLLLLIALIAIGCTEPYALQTNTFEDAIVVEATITNELKRQEIKLSRTYTFEEDGPTFEANATVYITDNLGNQYNFFAFGEKYISNTVFQALPNVIYQLNITTEDGKTYRSTQEKLTTVNEIQTIVPSVATKENDRGVLINVSSYDPTNTSKYYRYEYEETYKVIAPEWSAWKTILGPVVPGQSERILVVPREGETKTCYTTKKSDEIILGTTNDLSEDRMVFPIRFISNQNPIITHRYSILVHQFIQNLEAYRYYKTLKELSGSESILSQNQPGFFYGNVRAMKNPNEKVIGFFDVSTVSSQRIFFNYADLFPGEPLPPYFSDCRVKEFKYCFTSDPECKGAALNSIVGSGDLVYVDDSGNQTYFYMVSPPCGDCTRISSNIRPDFWID